MAEDPNMLGWQPGQPPPWLDLYGPAPGAQPLAVETTQYPPIDPIVAGATTGAKAPPIPVQPAPPPEPAPGPVTGRSTMGPKGRSSIGPALGGGQQVDEIPQPQFAPPWLQTPPESLPVQGLPGVQQPSSAEQAPLQRPVSDAVTQALAYRDQLPVTAMDPSAPIAERQKAWASMSPETRTQLVNNADPNQLAAIASSTMPPEELATIAVRHQQALLHQQSAQQLDLARKADEDARANFQTYQTAVQQANASTAQLMADAQKMSQDKIDPNEHGVGHFIASVITGALGGAVSQYTGGRNLALEELDKQTQRRIEAQQQNIQNGMQAIGLKRNLVAEQLQRSGDLYRAQETYRISQYDRAVSELQTRMQDYDPQGTTALRAAGAVQQVLAQKASALQAYNQQDFKNRLDQAKAMNEAATQQETVRHNKATEGLDWAKFGLEQTKATKLSPEDQKRQEELDGRQIGGVVYGLNPDGTVNRASLTVDGKPGSQPFIPRTQAQATALQNMAPHVNEVNRLANQMAHDIAALGTLDKSGKLGTAAHQKLMSDREALIFALHGAQGVEGFRPGTAEMLEKEMGGVDPDAWGRDATAGILRARDNINADFTGKLHVAGWQGDQYAPPDTSSTATAVDTPAQAENRKYLGKGAVRYDSGGDSVLTADAQRHLLDLQNRMSDPDPNVAGAAAEDLRQLASDAKMAVMRKAAAEALQAYAHDSALGSLPTEGETVGPATNTTNVRVGTDFPTSE